MTLDEALRGKEIPTHIRETLSLIEIPYFSFAQQMETGHLVIHTDLAAELEKIFSLLSEHHFPIERMVPISAYAWDDDASTTDNNTSAFNYRVVFGTDQLSNHAFGRAVDINPLLNPYTRRDGVVVPFGAVYRPEAPGTITAEGIVTKLFREHGWEWGGDWERKDWQHFAKP